MSQKTVLICGASSGIGLELAKQLTADGHLVIALSRNIVSLKKLKSLIPDLKLEFASIDLSKECQQDIVNLIGGKKIDHVIYNAGLLINQNFDSLTRDDFSLIYNVNVYGLLDTFKAVKGNLNSDFSSVTSISSVGGVQGSVKFPGLSAYSSSKAALIGLTECLSAEYADAPIHFNTLALGAVNTKMLQEAFPDYTASVSPEQMASYIINFVLNDSKLFNGKIISVNNSTP